MTPEEFRRVDEVFRRAVALDADARDAYLDDTCRGEPGVRAQVVDLLARDGAPHRLLDVEPSGHPPDDQRVVPTTVGPYRIIDVLGSGAMGVVYRAEQETPRRVVAVKVMRDAFSSARALRRFRQEADLLGRLQHPGVAQVIEAGTTTTDGEGAQPYIVMELVDGKPLVEHVRHHASSVRERVELVVRICDAVEHAHLSGIVHRDLKPANILVHDGGTGSQGTGVIGQPKILDFGVARLLDVDRTSSLLETAAGELVGTLPYMSPEQIEGDPESVDMRCDVYALGVILFEVLADRRPHDVAGKSLAEAARIICEGEPARLRTVERKLPADLETIVASAIERDVTRRYGSVAQLAGDLRRFLADEPILARRPTSLYQLSKFARRNRGLVTGFATAVLILVAGLVVSTMLFARAERRANEMRRALYAQRISLGQNAIESNDVRELITLLEACPEDLRHWEWRRLSLLSDQSERVFVGHTARVNDAAFSPDGMTLVTAGGFDALTPPADRERVARLWSIDGAVRRVVEGHENAVQSVAISPDGRLLATLSRNGPGFGDVPVGRLRLWRTEDGAPVGEVETSPGYAARVRFTPDGSALLVAGGIGRVDRVDVATLSVEWSRGAAVLMTDLDISPGGERVVASSWSGVVAVWEARSGEPVWEREPDDVRAVAFAPDGRTIAAGGEDRVIRILDADTGDEIDRVADVGVLVSAVAFAPDGRLVFGTADGVIHVRRASGEIAHLLGHRDVVTQLTFEPEGERLVSTSRDGTARLWRIDGDAHDIVTRPHGEVEVNRVAWSPDGASIVSAGDDGHARVVDVETGDTRLELQHECLYLVASDWSADGERIFTLGGDDGARLWDARTGAVIATWTTHERWAFCGAFDPAGTRIATGARGGARIWDGVTGALVHDLDTGTVDVLIVAWHPDGPVLATADSTGVVALWDAESGERIEGPPTQRIPIDALAFHPNGQAFVAGDRSGTIRAYAFPELEPLFTVDAHAQACEGLSFSPDGRRLLSSGRDGRIRLLDAATGDHVMLLTGHRFGVKSAVFSPDGSRIASTSRDHTVRIWNAAR